MDARIPPRDVKTITAGRAAFLLAAAVLLLGTNWPTLKIAMRGIEPLWFNAMRMLSASLVYALVLAVRGRLRWPQREDLPVVFGLGLLQFGLMSCLASYGVSLVGAGRTAILIYTNSIWVTTGAVLFLGERISRWQISGMGFGLAGIVLLFSPFDLDWNNQRILIGNGSVVLGSMIWSIALLQVRSHRWHADPLELLPHHRLGRVALADAGDGLGRARSRHPLGLATGYRLRNRRIAGDLLVVLGPGDGGPKAASHFGVAGAAGNSGDRCRQLGDPGRRNPERTGHRRVGIDRDRCSAGRHSRATQDR